MRTRNHKVPAPISAGSHRARLSFRTSPSPIRFLVALASKQFSGDERQMVVLDLVIAVLFILLFPVTCNNIALLANCLDMTILAGPHMPYTDYSLQINLR